MSKKILLGCLVSILLPLTALAESGETALTPIDLIPSSNHYVLEINTENESPFDFFATYIQKPLFSELKNSASKKIAESILESLKTGNRIFFSANSTGSEPFNNSVITLYDKDGLLNEIFKLLESEKQKFKVATVKGITFYHRANKNKYNTFVIGQKDGIIIMAQNLKTLKSILSLDKKDSLGANEQFLAMQGKLQKDYFSAIYIDMQEMGTAIAKKLNPGATTASLYQLTKYVGLSFKIEGSDLIMDSFSLGNPELMDKENFSYKDFAIKKHLYSVFPKANPIFFMETANLAKIFDLQMDVMQETVPTTIDYEQTFTESTGLKLKEDVYSWLDKETAFAMQDIGSAIPALTLMINAESNPDAAKKVLTLLDTQINKLIAEQAAEYEKYITKEEVTIKGGTFQKIKIDLTQLILDQDKESGQIKNIENLRQMFPPVEFYYGLTSDNLFIISNFPSLATNLDQGLENNETFQALFNRVKPGNGGISYISFRNAFDYATNFINGMGKTMNDPMPKSELNEFNYIKTLMSPLQDLIGVNYYEGYDAKSILIINLDETKAKTMQYQSKAKKLIKQIKKEL